MKSSRRPALLPLVCSLLALLAACGSDGEDPEDRMLSELSDAEHVEQCDGARTAVGEAGVVGLAHYTCIAGASIGGTCNMTIFEQCVQGSLGACLAPAATSPLRTCSATVAELRTCEVAFGTQHATYRSASCSMLPTSTPMKRAQLSACAAFCAKCAAACQ
jgi:hypothetical protein